MPKQVISSVLHLIGNTPIVEVSSFDTGKCRLFLKLESQNPGGSIKDRIGLAMIDAGEREGKITHGTTLIEATAGNTGLGLALVAAQRGYKLILIIPDKMSQEKILHLKALGAELIITRSDVERGHPEYYQDLAEETARKTPNSYYINQFCNESNARAHEETTGPEIWQQMNGAVDAVVCGIGSGGTMTGLSRYFARVAPQLEMILADPKGSILTDYINSGVMGSAGSWLVEGIGEDFVPPLADLSRVKKSYQITDSESFDLARKLLLQEGIFAGSSSGTLITAALKYCREQTTEKNVVTFVCDSGGKYLSKMYNDFWLAERGFRQNQSFGDLRDLISRDFLKREVVTVKANDSLGAAFARMRLYDISQLPVVDENKVIGIVDESDLLLRAIDDPDVFSRNVQECMTTTLQLIHPSAKLSALIQILNSGLVGIISSDEQFYGLVTKVDVLSFLRRQREDH